MRHRANRKHFSRDFNHKKALIRNLVYSLVEHGRIKTTLDKAKELRRHADRVITIGKRDKLNSIRLLLKKYPNKKAVLDIVSNLSQKYKDRNGGYTRIIKLGKRLGDNAEMAFIEWVDYSGVSKLNVKQQKVVQKDEKSEEEEKVKKGSTKKNISRKAKLIATKVRKKRKKTPSKQTKDSGVSKAKSTKAKKSVKPKQKEAKAKEGKSEGTKKRSLRSSFLGFVRKKPKKT